MEKWLIIHNCNSQSITHTINSICPDIQAESLDIFQFKRNEQENINRIPNYDRVITYPEALSILKILNNNNYKHSILPHVVFPAYHPDICYVFDNKNSHVAGPLGNYHSTIGFAAYKLGATFEEALKFFNHALYERAGYFDLWDQSEDNFIKKFANYNIDVTTHLRKAANGKCFMHSHNHAKIDIVFETTKAFLHNEGFKTIDGVTIPQDPQINGPIYPVYPEIAERYGFQGSYNFKMPGQYRYQNLETFLKNEFEAFKAHSPKDLKVAPEFEENYENVRSVLMDAR